MLFGLLLLVFAAGVYLYCSVDTLEPKIDVDIDDYELAVYSDSVRVCGDNTLVLNEYGLWEARLVGDAVGRGAAYGRMSRDLLKFQEDVFVRQIHEMISSERWVKFLHKLIFIFNRRMASHIPVEYREEIYAVSLSCTDVYDDYGTPYGRQLNYHAAHDIGHVMQEYMLVGCSSFALWGDESATGGLVVGRNFDFYVGDNFAKNKVILSVAPADGYRFVSVTWPGMMGVVSGMNEHGLTVTINAAKGAIPTSSAMPISLLTRHILQYATNIDEAYSIAGQFKTFVSEAILIASAKDGCAAVIEKTPEKTALFRQKTNRLVCTNHYQSEVFGSDKYNIENIATSDSPYRFARLNNLIDELTPIDSMDAVCILRNRYGADNQDIGLTNEKSINQFIAHHSVVFYPNELKIWVSTSPWQLGEYVCYDLNHIFYNDDVCASYSIPKYNIAADSIALKHDYPQICKYREQYKVIKEAIRDKRQLSEDYISDFLSVNPRYYQTYNIVGDYLLSVKQVTPALDYWRKALECEIPRVGEREAIIRKIRKHD